MDDPRQPDMFGLSPAQGGLFEEPVVVTKVEPHTPDSIRDLMHKLLAEARAASSAPWSLRKTRSHMVMFPYMAEWLPKEEGEQLLLEFREEMRWLGHDAPPPLAE
ncbi:MAG: hypothetical protein ABJB40_08165 [Acidobacteriota bacterium]